MDLFTSKRRKKHIKTNFFSLKRKKVGKTFGGITTKEISEGLKKQYQLDIDKKKIALKETIKTLGRFTVDVKFGDGVNAKLTVEIKPE